MYKDQGNYLFKAEMWRGVSQLTTIPEENIKLDTY